ncbi:GNAT family N-acetyltransferase [Chakrabartyella piscis]|uniref:GNAT family N-acetyltransferase n=1 Tax=Chakrabartyella piscis TaxID=2918914 RepID=UPI0029584F8D|nr:GNAT family N-acetyltransferase [Chakrabartyella piscis]
MVFENEAKEVLAELDFVIEGESLAVNRTMVDPSLRGQGIAAQLMEEIYAYAKEKEKTIRPVCTYAVTWMEKNSEK